jgi:hypothetical protein
MSEISNRFASLENVNNDVEMIEPGKLAANTPISAMSV